SARRFNCLLQSIGRASHRVGFRFSAQGIPVQSRSMMHQLIRELNDVAEWKCPAGDSEIDQVGRATSRVAYHGGNTASHRFVHNEAPGLTPVRRQNQNVRRRVERRKFALISESGEMNLLRIRSGYGFSFPAQWSIANEQSVKISASFRRPQTRVNKVERLLLRQEFADEKRHHRIGWNAELITKKAGGAGVSRRLGALCEKVVVDEMG